MNGAGGAVSDSAVELAEDANDPHKFVPDPAYSGDPVPRCGKCRRSKGAVLHEIWDVYEGRDSSHD